MVAVSPNVTSYSYANIYVDDVAIVRHNSRDSATTSTGTAIYVLVPPGSTYKVVISTGSILYWMELR